MLSLTACCWSWSFVSWMPFIMQSQQFQRELSADTSRGKPPGRRDPVLIVL